MTDAADVFDKGADTYEERRQRLIPPFEAFYATAAEALRLVEGEPRRVLDLGAGTGLLSARIRVAHPAVELTLLDGAPAMLDHARRRFGDSARYIHGDLNDPIPEGDWDAIVSALAIHHLSDPDKRDLFARIHQALQPGGVFVNAEQVAGPNSWLEHAYSAWHRDCAIALGCQPEEWHAAEDRMRLDRCCDLESQLDWLREIGFSDVDCLFKQHRFAVIFTRRS
jgi:tRNA (cmo5U34)-methyltransferase